MERIDELLRDERRLTSLMATLEARRREEERRERARAAEAERARTAARRRRPPRPAAPRDPRGPAPRRHHDHRRRGEPELARRRLAGLPLRARGAEQRHRHPLQRPGDRRGGRIPVRAVEGGRVEMAAPFEGYGPTVVVSHGGGYYSLYLYLKDVQVQQGATVAKGQVIGTVAAKGPPRAPMWSSRSAPPAARPSTR